MSTTDTQQPPEGTGPGPERPRPEPPGRRRFWDGRSELVVVVLLYVIATLLVIGTVTMDVQGESVPGPQFFPVIVIVVLYATATALLIDVLRNPQVPDTDPHPGRGDYSADMLRDLGTVEAERTQPRSGGISPIFRTYTDWKTLGMVVGAAVLFIVLLNPVGWLLSAAFLFWVVARALGSKRPIFDIGVALLVASIIQLAFNGLLGLPLPSGLLEGLL